MISAWFGARCCARAHIYVTHLRPASKDLLLCSTRHRGRRPKATPQTRPVHWKHHRFEDMTQSANSGSIVTSSVAVPYSSIWGLSNKALLFELVSPAFRDPFAFAEKPQVFLSRIVMSLFHCTEFTVFGTSKSLLVR